MPASKWGIAPDLHPNGHSRLVHPPRNSVLQLKALLLLTLALCSIQGRSQGNPPPPAATDVYTTAAIHALGGGTESSKKVFFSPGDTFEYYASFHSDNGYRVVRLQRRHLGLRVVNDTVKVKVNAAGNIKWAESTITAPITISNITPTATTETALAFGLAHFPYTKPKVRQAPELVIYQDVEGNAPRLAWAVTIDGVYDDGSSTAFTSYLSDDAKTVLGTERIRNDSPPSSSVHPQGLAPLAAATPSSTLKINDLPVLQDAVGTGETYYSGHVPIHAASNSYDGLYYLEDLTRGSHFVRDNTGPTAVTNGNNVWGSGHLGNKATVAADAEYVREKTWDYFVQNFGWAGFDDQGLSGYSWVHFSPNGEKYRNASFGLDASGVPNIVFGDGGADTYPFEVLDIAAHEFTHGIARYAVGFPPDAKGQTGGLDEGFANIFGVLTKLASGDPHYSKDYTIGSRVSKRDEPLASLPAPSSVDGAVDCHSSGDQGLERHNAAGPVDHAFYLFTMGSNGSNECAAADSTKASWTLGMAGEGNSIAQRIWFQALTNHLKPNSDYAAARQATLTAATELFGANAGDQRRDLNMAWAYVNVGPQNAKFADNAYDTEWSSDGNTWQTQELPGIPAVIKFHSHPGWDATKFFNWFTWHVGGYGETYNIRLDSQSAWIPYLLVYVSGCFTGNGDGHGNVYQGPLLLSQSSYGVWRMGRTMDHVRDISRIF